MALLKVTVGDKSHIIDCANKGTANAWGRTKIAVEVTEASGDDVTAFMADGGTIEKVVPAEKKAAAPAEGAAAAE